MALLPLALQLYTVRDACAEDLPRALEQVARTGYTAVEMAGDQGLTAGEYKKLVDANGLKITSGHVAIDALEGDLAPVVDYYGQLGVQYIVCPYLPDDRRKDAEGWKQTAGVLEEAGARLRAAGFQLCYHNHSFEFEKFDGEYGFDILYNSSTAANLQAELDTYWVAHGGEDPEAYIRKYSGRCPLIHLKDMAASEDRTFAEVGHGILNIPAILKAAEECGAKWIIVEQDTCPGDPMDSIAKSFKYLTENNLVQA